MASVLKQYTKQRPKMELTTYPANLAKDKKIVGIHVFGNLNGLDPKLLLDEELLKKTVVDAIKIAKMHLHEIKTWKFGGEKGGTSVMALITESHVVLHTWNEFKYATLDIYTCGDDAAPDAAFDHIVNVLKPKNHQKFYANRSSN